MPRVAMGMPVYNGERYLRETLDSLLSQTYTDFEVLISDNASTDATEEICMQYAEQDSRIRYHRQAENIGIFRNYDRVLNMADSELFKWSSSNDLCAPTFLECCVSTLEARPDAVLCYPRTTLFEENGGKETPYNHSLDVTSSDPLERYRAVYENMGLNNAMNGVIRVSELLKTSLNRVYLSSDVNMMGELALLGKFIEIPDNLFKRRNSTDAMTASNVTAFSDEPRDVLRNPNWDFMRYQMLGVWRLDLPLSLKLQLLPFLINLIWATKRKVLREFFT